MNNIKTYDEFVDNVIIEDSLSIFDFIELLMEEEHEMGYDKIDLCNEGWSFGSRGRSSDRTFRFTPGKNDTDSTSTEIFNDDKKFEYHEVLLPKSNVMSYNLYKISDMRVSAALKHPNKFKNMEKREIDFDSIERFMKRTSLYIYHLLKDNPVDIITYPQSSSDFNKDMVEYLMKRYKESPGIKCIPDLLVKDIRNVNVNTDVAKSIGLTDKEIHKLQKDVENWQFDADIYELRVRIDELNDSIAYAIGKRGRPTKDVATKKALVKNLEEQIKLMRKDYHRRGKDKTKDENGRAKKFEIKSLDDKSRRSIEGLFKLNPKMKDMRSKLEGKHIVIFDDNISSGATLDDICLELKRYNVASILPITLAIIPKTAYGNHEKLK